MNKEYIAFRCDECGMISVFPSIIGDGNRCIECKGFITPIGEARVYKKRDQSINLGIDVDTTQLDIALEKARELSNLMDSISPP